MDNDVIIAFEEWMGSTSRADGTMRLRLRHLRELASTVDPLTATTGDLERLLFRRRENAPETRKSVLSSWRLFYRFAVRKGLRVDDPTLDIESVKIPVRVPRIAPDDAITAALARATVPQRAMILLARYGCLRLTELTTLHTRAREGDMLRIVGKGDKERMVGVNDELAHALRTIELQQGPGFYFPGRASPHLHPQSVHKIIYRLTGCNPHSLRHAGATAAYNATRDLRAVQAMLGHASLATTQRYLHLDAEALRRVAAATVIPRRPFALHDATPPENVGAAA
ncbi:tyrosine-type recombinase/integrase [Microbacterium sp. NPDC058021]|uniref:tyrosine-type recombinase/integrase n=1 Tax=Microbacterium sp. NPDC058021 TaxID=3346306 RepID=UPI0036DB82A9